MYKFATILLSSLISNGAIFTIINYHLKEKRNFITKKSTLCIIILSFLSSLLYLYITSNIRIVIYYIFLIIALKINYKEEINKIMILAFSSYICLGIAEILVALSLSIFTKNISAMLLMYALTLTVNIPIFFITVFTFITIFILYDCL